MTLKYHWINSTIALLVLLRKWTVDQKGLLSRLWTASYMFWLKIEDHLTLTLTTEECFLSQHGANSSPVCLPNTSFHTIPSPPIGMKGVTNSPVVYNALNLLKFKRNLTAVTLSLLRGVCFKGHFVLRFLESWIIGTTVLFTPAR